MLVWCGVFVRWYFGYLWVIICSWCGKVNKENFFPPELQFFFDNVFSKSTDKLEKVETQIHVFIQFLSDCETQYVELWMWFRKVFLVQSFNWLVILSSSFFNRVSAINSFRINPDGDGLFPSFLSIIYFAWHNLHFSHISMFF